MIDEYLAELRRRLPLLSRRRVLEEAEEHLRLCARTLGEEEAVARFGSVEEVARSYRARAGRFYAALVLALALAYPVLTYPILENGLPPATWPSAEQMPSELAWKRDLILWLVGAAGIAGAVALAGYAWRRRVFTVAAVACLATLVVIGALGTILNVQWSEHVPGVPAALLALGPLQVAVALAGLALVWRSRESETLPQHPEHAADDLAL